MAAYLSVFLKTYKRFIFYFKSFLVAIYLKIASYFKTAK